METTTTPDEVRRYSNRAEDMTDDDVSTYIDDAASEANLHNDDGDFESQDHFDLLTRFFAAYLIDSAPADEIRSMSQGSRSVEFDTESDMTLLTNRVQRYDPSGELIPGINRRGVNVTST